MNTLQVAESRSISRIFQPFIPQGRLTSQPCRAHLAGRQRSQAHFPCCTSSHRRPDARRQATSTEQGTDVTGDTALQSWKQKAPGFLLLIFGLGATIGPAVDGIHGQVHLLQYDSAPVHIGSLDSSVWVFGLLGAFYAVLGALYVILDGLVQSGTILQGKNAGATVEAVKRADLPFTLLSLGVVATLHELSSILYAQGVPYGQIAAILAACAAANWAIFDRTKQGLLLATLCGLSAPASELLLMKLFHVWHYSRPDLIVGGVGLPSWVSCCYFFYTPWLANAARLAWKRL
ncbi:g9848 [Coccomyxa viridis]|uniref:G9848 protein n=1 Tax=Coccomyxa viridis TaxID=1274662 RepID=A0ABP1GAX7_9CHLO